VRLILRKDIRTLTILQIQEGGRFQGYEEIDGHGFSWRIWAVAGFGLFADSYCLFSIQTVLPWIAFICQSNGVFSNRDELTVHTVLLIGTIFGQLLFGILADSSGRLEAYSWDLILVIFAALLLAQISTGAANSSRFRFAPV
jgi:PHS family inorganic phosphate transporter-like MFS transporter